MGTHAADPDFVEDAADAEQNQAKTNEAADTRTDDERDADEQNAAKLTPSAEFSNSAANGEENPPGFASKY